VTTRNANPDNNGHPIAHVARLKFVLLLRKTMKRGIHLKTMMPGNRTAMQQSIVSRRVLSVLLLLLLLLLLLSCCTAVADSFSLRGSISTSHNNHHGHHQRRLPNDYGDFTHLSQTEAAEAGALAVLVALFLLFCCLLSCCCRAGRGGGGSSCLWDLVACVCLWEMCCGDGIAGVGGGDFAMMS
jgi:hypothetical protein